MTTTPPLRVGALFAGYGGLELAVAETLGAAPAWFCEVDPAPSKVLAHHWPDVPNLGDITAVDWASVEPVDVLAGGFPCQDVSLAGLRRGLHPDTRSGLWAHFAAAIDALRPSLVIVENVRGLLSAEAHSDLEPDPWTVGEPERERGPALRALGAVLGDLADLGYDAEWHGVRAADAGAPHGRFRVFLLARPADADGSGAAPRPELRQPGEGGHHAPDLGDSTDADAGRSGWAGRSEADPAGWAHGSGPRPTTPGRGVASDADADGERHGRREDPRMVGRLDRHHESPPRQRERPRPLTRDRSAEAPTDPAHLGIDRGRPARHRRPESADRRSTLPDTVGGGRSGWSSEPFRGPLDGTAPARRSEVDWGVYEPAIRRWENVTGRLAPSPTEVGSKGGHSLSPRFVEWMMGLPPGHVTDPAIGLTRNEQLKALGNGVVPQQAALALRLLLAGELAEPMPEAVA